MARRQDTRAKPLKASSKSKPAKVEKVAAAKPKGKKSVKPSVPAASKGASKALLDAVRTPVSAATTVKNTAKSKAKKAIKSAKDTARTLVSEMPKPSVPDVATAAIAAAPHQIGETVKAIGSQIVGALNTDVGRVMVAELLVYVAKSLTQAAANTETAADAKSALLNAGAKIGAAAADAGAKMVETGKSAAKAGSDFLDEGRSAAGSGVVAAAGEAAGGARDLVREVAQVAVSTVGGMMADVATKAIAKRGRKPKFQDAPSDEAAPATLASAGHRPPVL